MSQQHRAGSAHGTSPGATRRGPELLFEMFDIVETVLAEEDAIGAELASEIAKDVCNGIAATFGGRAAWTPVRRREIQGLSFFALTRRERRIAHALTRATVAAVATRYGLPESVIRLTAARVAIEERAASLSTRLDSGGDGER